jgi:hypothetical protein
MSERRSLSFDENEKDLLDYYDNNGKSKIGKLALRFYKENKDKIFINELKDLIGLLKPTDNKPIYQQKQEKINKLIR